MIPLSFLGLEDIPVVGQFFKKEVGVFEGWYLSLSQLDLVTILGSEKYKGTMAEVAPFITSQGFTLREGAYDEPNPLTNRTFEPEVIKYLAREGYITVYSKKQPETKPIGISENRTAYDVAERFYWAALTPKGRELADEYRRTNPDLVQRIENGFHIYRLTNLESLPSPRTSAAVANPA